MPTKAQLEEINAKLQKEIAEAKRQASAVNVPVTVEEKSSSSYTEAGGSHAIDHLTMLDNHEAPDTNKELREDIDERDNADLSFWNNSWTWVKAATSYGNKPEDEWFINPTAKLIGEVMLNVPIVFSMCEAALLSDAHKAELKDERKRHSDFLGAAPSGDLISESLDLLTNYQSRFFEAVQRYIGLVASYENQINGQNVDEERIERAQMNKEAAGAQCRAWAGKLITLVEAYHKVVTDDRAYNLRFDFSPVAPTDTRPPTREYSLYKWSITTTLNKVGRRLARSIKEGKMDADKYRIPRPWITDTRKGHQLNANALLNDFA